MVTEESNLEIEVYLSSDVGWCVLVNGKQKIEGCRSRLNALYSLIEFLYTAEERS